MLTRMVAQGATRQMTGVQLRRLRTQAGLSQTAVARQMGVYPTRVGHLERQGAVSQEAAARVMTAIAELVRERGA